VEAELVGMDDAERAEVMAFADYVKHKGEAG